MADFNTELTVKGTKEEYLAILKVLHTYADERYQQYREHRNCWYLDKTIGEVTEKTVEKYLDKGVFRIGLSGPYGVMNGPVIDEFDLFERLADAAPKCSFEGSVSGWDPGAEQGIDAKLENGQLFLRYSYKEFGGEWDDEEKSLPVETFCSLFHADMNAESECDLEDALSDAIHGTDFPDMNYEEFLEWFEPFVNRESLDPDRYRQACEELKESWIEVEDDADWDTVYDPITHEYHDPKK